jgi:rhomboid protease GluP
MTGTPVVTPPRVNLTLALVALNVAVFLAMAVTGVSIFSPRTIDLVEWGASYGPLTIGHQWWRLGAAMMLHIGLFHLVMNMLCLLSLGPLAESAFGTWGFLGVYVLSGLGGTVASLLVHPDIVGAGASGAIFGVAGAVLVAYLVLGAGADGGRFAEQQRRLWSFLLMNLAFGFVIQGIDSSAHIGGLILGGGLGWGIATRRLPGLPGRAPRLAGTMLAGVVIILAGCAGLVHWSGVTDQEYAAEVAGVAEARHQLDRKDADRRRIEQVASGLDGRIDTLEGLLHRYPDSADVALDLAARYAEADRYPDALRTVEQGLTRHPGNRALLEALGALSHNLRRFDRAVEAYESLLQVQPLDSETKVNLQAAYLGRAGLEDSAGQGDLAREDYRRVLALGVHSAYESEARRALDSLEGQPR